MTGTSFFILDPHKDVSRPGRRKEKTLFVFQKLQSLGAGIRKSHFQC